MTTAQQLKSPTRSPRSTDLHHLKETINHAAHYLPAQGPIKVFIHHNTLHAFENLTFDEALKVGGKLFGCQTYLPESRYRSELEAGRIRFNELLAVLREQLGTSADESIDGLCSREELRLAMLQYPLQSGPTEELVWFVAETDALRRIRPEVSANIRSQLIAETRRWVLRDLRGQRESGSDRKAKRRRATHPDGPAALLERFGDTTLEHWQTEQWESFTLQALWRVCCDGVRSVPNRVVPAPVVHRHRDLLLRATGVDTDLLVHDILIRFLSAFLDQGVAHWALPNREQGLYHSFCELYRDSFAPLDLWMRGLGKELTRLRRENVEPLDCIKESLDQLGIARQEWDAFITETLLALRGWAGMVYQVEVRSDSVALPIPEGSLIEYLAIRLLLERFALSHVAADALSYDGPLQQLRDHCHSHGTRRVQASVEQRAFGVFQLAQLLGWSPDVLSHLKSPQWVTLLDEIEQFGEIERQRIFHLAYERRFCNRSLDASGLHARTLHDPPSMPRFQLLCCLDEREESFRRHVEEICPAVQTFGPAGFFNVPMYYRGAADAHFVPLCPVVIRPQHWVAEEVEGDLCEIHRRRAETRRRLGKASLRVHRGSRTFAIGALIATLVGVLASIPLVARILFPRLTARIRRMFGRMMQTPPSSTLRLERAETMPGSMNGQIGFSLEEMANSAERLLRDIGLTNGFARIVLILGHGSSSMNNPHKSAYDCGACGGSVGGPNARAVARMLNDPRIRSILEKRGISIPAETVFVGGLHNTCTDTVQVFDEHRIPASHQQDFASVRSVIEQACERNAHERCRRFLSAPLTMSFAAARLHVESRSEDLAQVRPELGHASNAMCIVGRRSRTRGLYLDRRAFLTSYDPTQDDEDCTILTRVLSAAIPVCSGISLEYFFSHVDSAGWGCGSKLPHNITSLLGVMDGAASDLRTGLPWQMVEIHEPVRILFVIETSPEKMLRIMDRNPGIGVLCRNDWIYLATLDPESGLIQTFRDGAFHEYRRQVEQLPQAQSSVDWYRGCRDHLEFAQINTEQGNPGVNGEVKNG